MKRRWHELLLFTSLLAVLLSGCGAGTFKIYTAIDDDDPKMIASIAKQNKSALNTVNASNSNPLLYALKEGKKKAFRALLENGADPNKPNRRYWCATLEAARTPDPYWLREVMKHGGDPNLDNHGTPQRRTTTLMEACRDNCLENSRMLVAEYGADVNYICGSEDALIDATKQNQLATVLYLLQNGADFRRKTHRYCSFANSIYFYRPEEYKVEYERLQMTAIIDFLKQHGIEWNKPVQDGDIFVYR